VPNGSRTWYTYATVWADITPVGGSETVDQGTKKTQSDVTHILTMRFVNGVKPNMRFLFEGRYFLFVWIHNVDERNRTLEIEAREETDV
jgi:SPP1 family predicted phage head-tail adaptor